jgi:hypothetical protein
MTADWYPFDGEFLKRVSRRIVNEVNGVCRVVYDSEYSLSLWTQLDEKLTHGSHQQAPGYH